MVVRQRTSEAQKVTEPRDRAEDESNDAGIAYPWIGDQRREAWEFAVFAVEPSAAVEIGNGLANEQDLC